MLRERLPAEGYDAIVSISALHHLPLEDALRRLATAVRPGGVLAAVVLPQRDLRRECPSSWLPRSLSDCSDTASLRDPAFGRPLQLLRRRRATM